MRPIVILLVLVFAVFVLAQSSDELHEHTVTAVESNVIDGSVSPEKIRDIDAYRLFLTTIAESADASPEQKSQQLGLLQPISLDAADQKSTIGILAEFKTKYEALIESYNASAKVADANGLQADLKGFLLRRDGLVEGARSDLQSALTPEGMTKFNERVQSEKKNMQVAVEDAQ
jgi:hypothetical protein